MNLFRRIVQFATRAIKLAAMPLRDPSISTLFGYMDTAAGIAVTEWTAMNYSAFWAANKVLGEAVASLPVRLYKRTDDGGKKEVDDHPAVQLLDVAPNAEATPYVYRETQQIHTTSWGNGYAEVERNGAGTPVALWNVTPNRVVPDRDKQGRIYYRIFNPAGDPANIKAEDVLHIPGMGFDGLMGYSVVNMARDCLGLGLATERFGSTFFGNGGHPSGMLTTDASTTEQTRKNMAETWQLAHGGPDRSNKVAVLSHGYKYTPISCPPEDAQFLQTRAFNIVEIARWFNLPPHMLRVLEGQNRATIEQQAIEFVVYTLRPWLIRWEQELRRKLLTPREQKRLFFAHDLQPLLVGDVLTRYKAYALGRQWGWLSANDVLAKENCNPIENGDTYLEPVNMIEAGQQDKLQEPDATPPEPGRAPASPKKKNPAGAIDPVAQRGKKPTRDVKDALALLAAQPPSPKHEGHVIVPFGSVTEQPDGVLAPDLAGAKKKTVAISTLYAIRPDVRSDRVADFVKDPDAKPDKDDTDGYPADRPYVVEEDGVRYVYDGTHRVAAARMLGATKVKVYYIKV